MSNRSFVGVVFAFCLVAAVGAEVARADLFGLAAGWGRGVIVQFDDQGRFVRSFPGGAESVQGIVSTDDGWLYQSSNALGGGYLLRSRVEDPTALQTLTPVNLNGPYRAPGGIAVGPDGNIYGTGNANEGAVNGVLRFNSGDRSLTPVVSVTPNAQEFLFATAVSPSGDIYLGRRGPTGDTGIDRFSSTGSFLRTILPSSPLGPTDDFTFGPDGNLYVPTLTGVWRYNPQTAAVIGPFIPNGSGGLDGATDLDFGPDGFVYVNSPGANSVLRYDATTGAFRGVFVDPAQYQLAPPGGLRQIELAVPEPAALVIVGLSLPVLLRRARQETVSEPDLRSPWQRNCSPTSSGRRSSRAAAGLRKADGFPKVRRCRPESLLPPRRRRSYGRDAQGSH